MRRNLAREQASSEWTFDDLTKAILKEIRILEAGYQVTDSHSSSRSTASFHVGLKNNSNIQTTKKSPVCAFCKGPHPSHSCSTITDYPARIDLVKRENLCFNCLGHHKVSQCALKFRCKKCKKRHYTSLCNNESPKPNEGKSSGTSADAQTVPVTTTASFLTSTPEDSHPHSNTTCLLKTAVAPVIAGQTQKRANILFDEGAQHSFISAGMAAKLCLQPTTTQGMTLASFGTATASYQELGVATVEIETITGDRIPISVLVIPSIAAPIQSSINTSVRNMPYLQGLELAHPVTSDQKFEISLLIGTDYYWSFIQDHIVRGEGLTAQQSKLGCLLSGPVPSSIQEASSSILLQLTSTVSTPKEPDLEQFWSIEAIGTSVNKSSDPSFLKKYQENCIHQSPTGMYVAKFP